MITELEHPITSPYYENDHAQWNFRKHRAKRALIKILGREEGYWYAYQKQRSNNLNLKDFWHKVATEIRGHNVGGSWMDKLEG